MRRDRVTFRSKVVFSMARCFCQAATKAGTWHCISSANLADITDVDLSARIDAL